MIKKKLAQNCLACTIYSVVFVCEIKIHGHTY